MSTGYTDIMGDAYRKYEIVLSVQWEYLSGTLLGV